MDLHGSERGVMEKACRVLWTLNAPSAEEMAIITETGRGGGIQRCFAALDAFPSERAVVEGVCGTTRGDEPG
jgi:hypothetical protein